MRHWGGIVPRTYEPIASTTLGSASATVTFSSIAGTYTDLVIVETVTFSAGSNQSLISFGDSSSLYSVTTVRGDGTSTFSARFTSQGSIGSTPGVSVSNTTPLVVVTHIQSYANTSVNKTFLRSAADPSGSVARSVGLWRNTAAIDTVVLKPLTGNFASGSTFALYGIKAA